MLKASMSLIAGIIKRSGSGLNRVADFLMKHVVRSKLIQVGDDRNLYKTRFDDYFWLNETGYVDQCIMRTGIFEPDATAIVMRIIKNGDVVLDVGSNIGYYSVLFSRLVGQNGKVLCFEPTEYYGSALRRNLEANVLRNVVVFPFGLSDSNQSGEIQIGVSSATLHSFDQEMLIKSEIIRLKTLNEFIAENPLEKIDFIKVDIDGHEPQFLDGAWDVLEKYNPLVLLEINHLNYVEAGRFAWDFYDLLRKKEYNIYHENGLVEIQTKKDFLIKCGNFFSSANIFISRKKIRLDS